MPAVEIPSSVEQRPSDRAVTFPRSAVQLPTLHAIRDDPSAVDVQIGTAFPDDVIRARALSLVRLDHAKHMLDIDGVALGALIRSSKLPKLDADREDDLDELVTEAREVMQETMPEGPA